MIISKLIKIIIPATVAGILLSGCGAGDTKSNSLPRANTPKPLELATDSLWAKAEAENIELHSVMIVQHDSVIYEHWANGAHPDSLHILYSVSKTFTSLGTGLAISDSVLALDEKVIDIFPDCLPDSISEELADMTVEDLLTMSSGHAHAPELYTDITSKPDGNWEAQFLSYPVDYTPGTVFSYNSMGSFMLASAIQRRTGKKLLDYLDERLFKPMGIEGAEWVENPDGVNTGGWGLFLKTEDLAKAGLLMLNRGKWQGQQLIAEDWINAMSEPHIQSVQGTPNSLEFIPTDEDYINSDWVQGYGYQVWRCRHNAYRADGTAGQFIIVIPDVDAVVVLTANSESYQKEINLVWDYILPVLESNIRKN